MALNKKAPILIVDDNNSNLKILEQLLEKDYNIFKANSSMDAYQVLIENKTDRIQLIFLDVMMPGIDGIEFCKLIRKEYDDLHLKIIFVTAKSFTKNMMEGYDAGGDDYITKPINLAEVRAKAKVFTQFYQSETELALLNNTLQIEINTKTRELLQKETLSAIGIQTAQIVHDLKSPLQVISLSYQLLNNQFKNNKTVQVLKNGVDSLTEIIATILQSGQQISNNDSIFDIREIINLAISQHRTFAGLTSIEFSAKLDEVINIKGNKIHFQQIIDNFIKNSVESISSHQKEGIITIEHASDGNFESIVIEDNGPGIPKNLHSKIFNPFFTTKVSNHKTDSGTGLGLSSCKRMIESYGGNIELDTSITNGSRFILNIPSV